jgi:hypothetical protein
LKVADLTDNTSPFSTDFFCEMVPWRIGYVGPDLVKATTAAYLELDQLSLVRSSSFFLVAMFLKVGAVLTAFFF